VRRAALAVAFALCAAACSDPREAELAAELVALQESRVARSSFERMRAEVASGEAAVAALEVELEALGPQLGEAEAAVGAIEAALQHEIERNGELNREIRAGQERLKQAAERQATLEQEIAIARARARTFKDQAAAFATELRPEDPQWARRLRIQSLREFLGEVRTAWPRDPVLAEAAQRELPADEDAATRLGAELAARIRDRVAEVYGLGDGEASAGPEPVAGGPAGES
jgi:chromosome segregation ATPase